MSELQSENNIEGSYNYMNYLFFLGAGNFECSCLMTSNYIKR